MAPEIDSSLRQVNLGINGIRLSLFGRKLFFRRPRECVITMTQATAQGTLYYCYEQIQVKWSNLWAKFT